MNITERKAMVADYIAKSNRQIARFMGYIYYEENIHYTSDSGSCMDTFYSKVPIEVYNADDCKLFELIPNPDFKKEDPEKWNPGYKFLDWTTVNYGQWITNPQYHSSWDWLMPVVERIQDIEVTPPPRFTGYRIEIVVQGYVQITGPFPFPKIFKNVSTCGSTFKAIYQAVVYFIEWYNSQKINNRL